MAFLVGLAFPVAAANLPVPLYSLYWRNFTTRGGLVGVRRARARCAACGVVTGRLPKPRGDLPLRGLPAFPLPNPGIVSIPLGFLAGWIGTVVSPETPDGAKHAETEVRRDAA